MFFIVNHWHQNALILTTVTIDDHYASLFEIVRMFRMIELFVIYTVFFTIASAVGCRVASSM